MWVEYGTIRYTIYIHGVYVYIPCQLAYTRSHAKIKEGYFTFTATFTAALGHESPKMTRGSRPGKSHYDTFLQMCVLPAVSGLLLTRGGRPEKDT